MAVEFWTMGRGSSSADNPKYLNSAGQAVRAEEVGYDGIGGQGRQLGLDPPDRFFRSIQVVSIQQPRSSAYVIR